MDYNQQIIEAKRRWEEAYALGDEAGMNAAHQDAENARMQARMSGDFDSIADYLQDGTDLSSGADYNTAAFRYSSIPGNEVYEQINQKSRPWFTPEQPKDNEDIEYPKEEGYEQYMPGMENDEDYLKMLGGFDSHVPKTENNSDLSDYWKPKEAAEDSWKNEPVMDIIGYGAGKIGDALSWIGKSLWRNPNTLKRGR